MSEDEWVFRRLAAFKPSRRALLALVCESEYFQEEKTRYLSVGIQSLDKHVLTKILSHCNPEDVFHMALVCKEWARIISSSAFWKSLSFNLIDMYIDDIIENDWLTAVDPKVAGFWFRKCLQDYPLQELDARDNYGWMLFDCDAAFVPQAYLDNFYCDVLVKGTSWASPTTKGLSNVLEVSLLNAPRGVIHYWVDLTTERLLEYGLFPPRLIQGPVVRYRPNDQGVFVREEFMDRRESNTTSYDGYLH